nr:MazG nucleotide pyrophosphohydrolase domain-containing protein [Jiella flava]
MQQDFEAASRAYCAAHGLGRDPDWFMLKLKDEVGELTQAWNRLRGRARRGERSAAELHKNLEDEAADVLGHILLLAQSQGMDLHAAIERKWRFTM